MCGWARVMLVGAESDRRIYSSHRAIITAIMLRAGRMCMGMSRGGVVLQP
jgi:hypothetical protein